MSGYQQRDYGGGRSGSDGYFSAAMKRNMQADGYGGVRGRLSNRGSRQSSYNTSRSGGGGWRSQVVSPWESGMVPGGGNFNQNMGFSHSSNAAINILNAVLSSSGGRYESVHARLGPRRTWEYSRGSQYTKKKKFVPKKGNAKQKNQKKKKEGAATEKDKKEGEAAKTQEGKETTEETTGENQDAGMEDENTDPKSSEGEVTDVKNDEAGEKDDTATEEKENKGTEAVKIEIPPDALECYACDKAFKTANGFLNHLDGKNHERLAAIHLEKSEGSLELLRAQSKLASQRHIVNQRTNRGKIAVCHKCQCPYKGGMGSHLTLRPHKLVALFNKCTACRTKFDNRAKLEHHLVTVEHLSRQYEMKQRIHEKARKFVEEEQDFPEMEAMSNLHDAVIELLNANFKTKVWNLDQIHPYDPSMTTGINYIERIPQFYCTVCTKKVLHTSKAALAHFKTQKHHENYLEYLKVKKEVEEVEAQENQFDKDMEVPQKENEEEDTSTESGKLNDVLDEVDDSISEVTETLATSKPVEENADQSEATDEPEVQVIEDDSPMDGIEEPDIEVIEKPVIDVDDSAAEVMNVNEETDDLEVIEEPSSPTLSSPRGRRGRGRGRARGGRKSTAKK